MAWWTEVVYEVGLTGAVSGSFADRLSGSLMKGRDLDRSLTPKSAFVRLVPGTPPGLMVKVWVSARAALDETEFEMVHGWLEDTAYRAATREGVDLKGKSILTLGRGEEGTV